MDIMFDNVSNFACYELDDETSRMFLVLRKPCKIFKKCPTKDPKKPYLFQEINSPFTFKDKGLAMFMNYWNLKQVIMLEGQLDLAKDYKGLFDDLMNLDVIPRIEFIYK